MRPVRSALLIACLAAVTPAVTPAWADPLQLYQSEKDPLAVPGAAGPIVACGGVPGACPPQVTDKQTKLPFTYGLSVNATVVGSNHGSGFGEGVSGWVHPDGTPLTLYFDVQHFQPAGK